MPLSSRRSDLRQLIFSATRSSPHAGQRTPTSSRPGGARHFAIADARYETVSSLATGAIEVDTIEKLHARKELVTGVPTGFRPRQLTSDLQPSDRDRGGPAVDGENQAWC
jgi:hypothetical protein